MRFPEEVLRRRVSKFQEEMRRRGIDASMVRTSSTFTYFTGTRWLRPALLIPAEGDPIAFVPKGEEKGFLERTWIRNVITYSDGGELMRKVSGEIREAGYKVLSLEFGLERDAYILFYEMFRKLNPQAKVVDFSEITAVMRMIKDEYELKAVKKAGEIAQRAMEKTLEEICPGIPETEIASVAYRELYSLGSEEPHVYVNAGPWPRIHAEPFRDSKVNEGTFLTVSLAADYDGYYANVTRSVLVGEGNEKAKKALECASEVYKRAAQESVPGRKFSEVIRELDKVYAKYEMLEYRVIGYAHGVGLQVEEPPITTIVPAHRSFEISPGMVLAMVHSPILIPGLGQVKFEDTYIVKEESLEAVTGPAFEL